MVKYTKETLLTKLGIVHNNFYDYSLVDFININVKIKIICPIHGTFEQKPMYHLKGSGCLLCGEKSKRNKRTKDTNWFTHKSNIVHNNKYDYSLTNYVHNKKKVEIICPIHGVFEQIPSSHLVGKGCKKCGNNIQSTYDEFIEKANIIHNSKYDYSLINYVHNKKYIKIIKNK